MTSETASTPSATPNAASDPEAEQFEPSGSMKATTEERLAALEAENRRLLERIEARPTQTESSRGGRVLRNIAATLCIVLGVALIPAGVLVTWAKDQLVDEERFVQTFAVLSEYPVIQREITQKVTTAIDNAVDIDGLTNAVFDGLGDLGLPRQAASALNLLRGPAASGIRGMVESGVGAFVASDAFSTAWEGALRMSHRALVATVSHENTADNAVVIDPSGQISLQLGPVIDAVKASLTSQGMQFASLIPTINLTIPILQSDAVPMITLVYTLTTVVGWWLPVLVILLLIAGVSVAPRRSTATMSVGIGLVIGAGITLAAFAAVDVVLQLQSTQLGVTGEALSVLLSQIVGTMREVSFVILALGLILFVLGLSQGNSRAAHKLRALFSRLNTGIVTWAAKRDIVSGALGGWLRRFRGLTRAVLCLLIVLSLVVLPFSGATIAWLTVIGLILWWVLTLLEAEVPAPQANLAEDGAPGGPSPEGFDGSEASAAMRDTAVLDPLVVVASDGAAASDDEDTKLTEELPAAR